MSNTHALQDDGVPESNNAKTHGDPVPLNNVDVEALSISWVEGQTVELVPGEDIPPDISDSDKYFVENILYGPLIAIGDAHRFLSKGGVLILTTWLSEAVSVCSGVCCGRDGIKSHLKALSRLCSFVPKIQVFDNVVTSPEWTKKFYEKKPPSPYWLEIRKGRKAWF